MKTGKVMLEFEEIYKNNYKNDNFKKVYLEGRQNLYNKIFHITRALKVKSVLDIGCAYGQLIRMLNKAGVISYGLDLPIEELIQYHTNQNNSNIILGSIANPDIISRVSQLQVEMVIILDTLRYLEDKSIINFFKSMNPSFILIKEVSDSTVMRYMRRNENDLRLVSPAAIRKLFPDYKVQKIYISKFLANLSYPNGILLKLVNLISPTYTLLLTRKVENNAGRHTST